MWDTAIIFTNKKHGLQKKNLYRKSIFFAENYVKIIELHIVRT